MSIPTFHFPSAFFCHNSQYLPLSLLPSFIVIWYVPVKTAMSPDFATSTRVVFQLISRKLSRNPFQRFRIPSLFVTAGWFGGKTTASSASNATVLSRSLAAANFDHSASASRTAFRALSQPPPPCRQMRMKAAQYKRREITLLVSWLYRAGNRICRQCFSKPETSATELV
jgi:hypothetical protein